MKTFFAFGLAAGAVCLLFMQGHAQPAPTESPALFGTATNGDTEILSDKGGEFYYKLKTYIYRGNVRVYNPQMKLTCELLTIESPEMNEGKFNRATAETNVVIDWVDDNGTNHATADRAVYTYVLTNLATLPEQHWETNALVVLSGHPYVTNKIGTWEGDPITWDRIRDVISTPAIQKSTIHPSTNSTGAFGPGAPPKTNSSTK